MKYCSFLLIFFSAVFILFLFMKTVAKGWKPGAVSKRLLRMLKKAKLMKSTDAKLTPTRKAKKRVEQKPTLIISKFEGEYRVEMQVTSENNDLTSCSPLVYKIQREDNEDRIRRREMIKQRLIKEAVKDWTDPYHPEVCEKTCLKTFNQAVGVVPFDQNNPDCICSEELSEVEESCSCEDLEDVSDDSSLDLNWEIHFSPPTCCRS